MISVSWMYSAQEQSYVCLGKFLPKNANHYRVVQALHGGNLLTFKMDGCLIGTTYFLIIVRSFVLLALPSVVQQITLTPVEN